MLEKLQQYKEYHRQSPKIIMSLTKKILESYMKLKFEYGDNYSNPNLMNKSLPFMKKKSNTS